MQVSNLLRSLTRYSKSSVCEGEKENAKGQNSDDSFDFKAPGVKVSGRGPLGLAALRVVLQYVMAVIISCLVLAAIVLTSSDISLKELLPILDGNSISQTK